MCAKCAYCDNDQDNNTSRTYLAIKLTKKNQKREEELNIKDSIPSVPNVTQWFRTAKNRDVRTEPLAHSFLCFARSLTLSRACGKVNDKMSQNDLVLSHSA